jgi:hypothetical protein
MTHEFVIGTVIREVVEDDQGVKNGDAKDQQQLDCAQGHGFAALE